MSNINDFNRAPYYDDFDKYKNYFSSKSWYRGVNSNYDTLGLSSQELKLASLIKSKE